MRRSAGIESRPSVDRDVDREGPRNEGGCYCCWASALSRSLNFGKGPNRPLWALASWIDWRPADPWVPLQPRARMAGH